MTKKAMEFGLISLGIWICLLSCTFLRGTDMSNGIISDSFEASVNFEKENSAFGSEWILDQFEDLLPSLREFSVAAFDSDSTNSRDSHIETEPTEIRKWSSRWITERMSSDLVSILEDFAQSFLIITSSCKSQDKIRSAEETSLSSKMIDHTKSLLINVRKFTSADYIFTTNTIPIRNDIIMTLDLLKVIFDGVYKTVVTMDRSHMLATASSITTLVMLLHEISIEGKRQQFLVEIKNTCIRKKEGIKEILANCKIVKYEKSKKTKQSKENVSTKHPCINMRVTDIIPRFTVEYLENVAKLRHYQMGAFILPSRLILGLAAMPLETPVEVKEKTILQQYNVYKQRKNRKWINDLRNLAVGMMPRGWIDSNIVAI